VFRHDYCRRREAQRLQLCFPLGDQIDGNQSENVRSNTIVVKPRTAIGTAQRTSRLHHHAGMTTALRELLKAFLQLQSRTVESARFAARIAEKKTDCLDP